MHVFMGILQRNALKAVRNVRYVLYQGQKGTVCSLIFANHSFHELPLSHKKC